MMLYYKQHRFMISAKTILVKILPAKVAKKDRTPAMMDSFGMTNSTIQIKLSLNKEVYTQTMLMARHQKIAKLFDEDFGVTR